MRYKKTMNIKTLLQKSPLADVMQRGIFLSQLNDEWRRIVPFSLAMDCKVANVHQDTLHIYARNAGIRQALLFQQTTLLAQLQKTFPQISNVSISVNPTLGLD